ncbi:MAG: hypothetical protein PUD47_01525 [Bacteroidales bacterium]|nr:hypothetical protein [Bacteroidales bacterium]
MERTFRVGKASYPLILLTILCIALILWFAIKVDQYTVFIAIVVPLGLWVDQFLSKIIVQENGDVWMKRGFTGMVRIYGVSKLVYNKKAWSSQQIQLKHTKGYVTLNPVDKKGFIACMKEHNPLMEYEEK